MGGSRKQPVFLTLSTFIYPDIVGGWGRKSPIYADVLYGWPLSPLIWKWMHLWVYFCKKLDMNFNLLYTFVCNPVLNISLFKFQVSFGKKIWNKDSSPSVIELQCHCWQKLKKKMKMKDLMRRNSLEQIHKLWWVTRFEESFAAMWLFA